MDKKNFLEKRIKELMAIPKYANSLIQATSIAEKEWAEQDNVIEIIEHFEGNEDNVIELNNSQMRNEVKPSAEGKKKRKRR